MLPEKLVISLLNFRSLRRHFDDIAHTPSLVQTDILCFTETQLLASQGGLYLPATMGEFYVTYNSIDNRFCSLTLCYRDNLHLLNHVKMNGFSILTFRKPSFSPHLLCIEQIQIILGNFNTDAFDSNNNVSLSNSLEKLHNLVDH